MPQSICRILTGIKIKRGVMVLRSKHICSWASEASPTLGCSIEISRDIYINTMAECHSGRKCIAVK